MSEYTLQNTELQKQILELIGMKPHGVQRVTITMTISGTIEVDAVWFVSTEKKH
jgi:hypothetical protein